MSDLERAGADPALRTLLDEAVTAADATEGSIVLLVDGGASLQFAVCHSPAAAQLLKQRVALTDSISGLSVSLQQPMIVNDTAASGAHNPAVGRATGTVIKSIMVSPLSTPDQEFGALTAVNSHRTAGFSPDDLQRHLGFAGRIALRLSELNLRMENVGELLDRLEEANGAGVRVAIVDSGVEVNHPWVGGRLVESWRVVTDARGTGVAQCPPTDVFGHGTAVAGQVRRFAPAVDLVSVQVLGGDLKANSQSLLTALRWLSTQHVSIVNLSLSTMREQLALMMCLAVDDLYARDVACVCARGYHTTGKAYPTDFAGTIGVSYGKQPMARLAFRAKDNTDFNAAGIGITVAWKDGGTKEIEGSSFACPLVTGLAARLLSLRPSLTPYELTSLLKAYAERQDGGWHQPWMDDVEQEPR